MTEEPRLPDAPVEPEAPKTPGRLGGRVPLLVVCGCVFLLIVAVGIKWSGERRAAAECRETLRSLWSAASTEAEARGGQFPSGNRAIEELVLRYLHHQRYWSCPRTGRGYMWTSRERNLGDDPRWLLAWERVAHGWPFPRHRALFVDGRIEELSADELKELLARERRQPPPKPPKIEPRPELREDPYAPPAGSGWRLSPKESPPKAPAELKPPAVPGPPPAAPAKPAPPAAGN
jgi:hypothetical protein